MDSKDLDSLIAEIGELRRAVRKANPFLREVLAIRGYALLSIPMGLMILVLCLASHFLGKAYGSFEAIPSEWKIVAWICFAAILLVGAVSKFIIIGKRAATVERGATFLSVMRAWYGGSWLSLNLPAILCIVVVSFFAIRAGHPWLVVPVAALFISFVCNGIAVMLGRREYYITGWYSLISGLLALFFVESAPFLWSAAVWAGIFLVFGVSSLATFGKDEG